MSLATAFVVLSDADSDTPLLTAIATVSKDDSWDHGAYDLGLQRCQAGALWVDRPYATGNPSVAWAVGKCERGSEVGGACQLLNECNLGLEGFVGGPAAYRAYWNDCLAAYPDGNWIAQPPSPGVPGWQEWVIRDAPRHAVHAYGDRQMMQGVVQWFLDNTTSDLYVTECNWGAGNTVDVGAWTRDHLRPFLDWCATQRRIKMVAFFAWQWDQAQAQGGTPVNGKGTPVETLLREWVAPEWPVEVTPMPATLTGRGLWVWYVEQCGGIDGVITEAQETGCRWVTVKCGDAGNVWSQFSDDLIQRVQAAGLEIYAWAYCYGDDVDGEIEVARQALAKNVNGFIADAEAEYEGKADAAERYASAVRELAGSRIFAYAPIPIIDYHTALPYVQFNAYCDLVMPQFYTGALGPPWDLAACYEQWDRWGAQWTAAGLKSPPLAPVGQAYDTATPDDIRAFEQAVTEHENPAWSFWSMDAMPDALVQALAESPSTSTAPEATPASNEGQFDAARVNSALDTLWAEAGPDVNRQAAIVGVKVAFGLQEG